MRIEKISDNKIKIFVSREDRETWNVTLKKLTDNSPEAQELFWFAMKQAERDVKFVANGAQLVVEAAPSAAIDGFVMTVSKVFDESELKEAITNISRNRMRPAEVRVKKKKPVLPSYIYEFDDFEDVCAAAGQIADKFFGRSALYKYNEKFYLYMIPFDDYMFFETGNVLLEYARRKTAAQTFAGYLNEHARLMIAEGAVEVMAQNFI